MIDLGDAASRQIRISSFRTTASYHRAGRAAEVRGLPGRTNAEALAVFSVQGSPMGWEMPWYAVPKRRIAPRATSA